MENVFFQSLAVLLLMMLFLGVGEIIGRAPGFYRRELEARNTGRFSSLDGLRGFLALGVFLHHSCATHHYLRTGDWQVPIRPLNMMGGVPVTFFFMMTGFLFWLKALKGKRRLPLVELYRSRMLRIVPLYLLSAAAMLTIVLVLTGLPRSGQLEIFFGGVGRLLGGAGILPLKPINGFDPGDINASVLWTLHSEWVFYLLLPFLALFARPAALPFFVAICLGLHFEFRMHLGSSAIFVCGMIAAQIIYSYGPKDWAKRPIVAVMCIGIVCFCLLFFSDAYTIPVYCLLFFVFLSLVNGGTLGGILATRGARVLGSMSYSIYLLHGIVLFLSRPLLAPLVRPAGPTPQYWMAAGGIGVVVIGISSLTYRFVEYPFIALEQHLKRRLPPPHSPHASVSPDLPSKRSAAAVAG